MTPAGEDHAGNMHAGQREQQVGQAFVQFLDPFHAPETVGSVEPAAGSRSQRARQQGHDHPAAQRVMPEVARFTPGRDQLRIAQGEGGSAHETCETGMA